MQFSLISGIFLAFAATSLAAIGQEHNWNSIPGDTDIFLTSGQVHAYDRDGNEVASFKVSKAFEEKIEKSGHELSARAAPVSRVRRGGAAASDDLLLQARGDPCVLTSCPNGISDCPAGCSCFHEPNTPSICGKPLPI